MEKNEVAFSMEQEMKVDQNGKILVNAGSVGQPRDGDPRACCAIYDDKEEKVSIHRVEYDLEKTIQKIESMQDFPDFLGERLRYGK